MNLKESEAWNVSVILSKPSQPGGAWEVIAYLTFWYSTEVSAMDYIPNRLFHRGIQSSIPHPPSLLPSPPSLHTRSILFLALDFRSILCCRRFSGPGIRLPPRHRNPRSSNIPTDLELTSFHQLSRSSHSPRTQTRKGIRAMSSAMSMPSIRINAHALLANMSCHIAICMRTAKPPNPTRSK